MSSTKPWHWYFLSSIPIAIYFTIIWLNTVNAPFFDDFYEVLFPLLLYREAETPITSLQGLFWQYFQHYCFYNKSVYWANDLITGRANFILFTLIGNFGLLAYFLLLTRKIQKQHLFILPCISAVFFSIYPSLVTLLSSGSLQMFTSMTFVLATLLLLEKEHTTLTIATACIMCWIAVFTQANNVLLLPISFVILLDNMQKKKATLFSLTALVWIFSCLLCFSLYYTQKDIAAITQFLAARLPYQSQISNPIQEIIVNFLASLASLPIRDGSNPLHATPIGTLHLFLIIFFLKNGWKSNRALTLLLLFCVLTLLSISVMRTPYFGSSAFVDRYKLYTTSIICIELLLAPVIFSSRWWVPIIAALAIFIGAYSYYLNISSFTAFRSYREQSALTWFTSGRIHSLPLANAILDEAYATKLYNPALITPWHTLQPLSIEPIGRCPDANTTSDLKLQITNNSNSRAVLFDIDIKPSQSQSLPTELWLCGENTYHIKLPTSAVNAASLPPHLVIIEKKSITPSNKKYQIKLGTSKDIWDSGLTVDMQFYPQIPEDCIKQKEWQAVLPRLFSHYCH